MNIQHIVDQYHAAADPIRTMSFLLIPLARPYSGGARFLSRLTLPHPDSKTVR